MKRKYLHSFGRKLSSLRETLREKTAGKKLTSEDFLPKGFAFVGFLSILLIGTLLSLSFSYGAGPYRNLSGFFGDIYNYAPFQTHGSGGNGGLITFVPASDEWIISGSGIYIDNGTIPRTFTGSMFIETVGWAELINVELNGSLGLSGYAWSPNAGYIDFTAQNNSYSGVYYIAGRNTFTGYAWSPTIGYLSFASGTSTEFLNKVKILGAIGGNKAYDSEYYLGTKFESQRLTPVMNLVRRNVALTVRNFPSTKINTLNTQNASVNGVLYYKGNNPISNIGTKMDNENARTLIVEGGDIYINNDVPKDIGVNAPRVIIALRDASGSGGNIYIFGDTKNIYSSLIAEGSIYSGESESILYNGMATQLGNLPLKQLYINGSILSRNTIGGSSLTPPSCPFTETSCTTDSSLRYDWNFFRSYDQTLPNRSDRTGYDEYSIIIETDSRILGDPPPGIENLSSN